MTVYAGNKERIGRAWPWCLIFKASHVLPADQYQAGSEPHHDYETEILGKEFQNVPVSNSSSFQLCVGTGLICYIE